MQIKKHLLIVLSLALLAVLVRPAASDPTPIPTGLHVLAAEGTRPLSDHEALYDFGSVNALDAAKIARTFTVQNDGKGTLNLTRLQPSCFCTSAEIDSSTLMPGQKTQVHVTVNTTHLAPGRLEKSVMVFAQDRAEPVALLEMTGELRPALTFTPALLDFGSSAPGKTAGQTLTVTWDPRLTPHSDLPALTSSDPRVRVTALPDAKRSEAGVRSRTYQITLSPSAAPGSLDVTLAFALPAEKIDGPALSAFTNAFALVVGKVTAR